MLDQTDLNILNELSNNSRIAMKDLGEKVHLSSPATAARIKKLEENHVIMKYTTIINQDKIGYPIHIFITIFTLNPLHNHFLDFVVSEKEFIINNYKVSGEGCYLLECRFPSNEILDNFLIELNKHANYKLSMVIN